MHAIPSITLCHLNKRRNAFFLGVYICSSQLRTLLNEKKIAILIDEAEYCNFYCYDFCMISLSKQEETSTNKRVSNRRDRSK
jgi:uncharacterized protein YutD